MKQIILVEIEIETNGKYCGKGCRYFYLPHYDAGGGEVCRLPEVFLKSWSNLFDGSRGKYRTWQCLEFAQQKVV